eukprot:789940-Prorocentrum_minimum.AAC.1
MPPRSAHRRGSARGAATPPRTARTARRARQCAKFVAGCSGAQLQAADHGGGDQDPVARAPHQGAGGAQPRHRVQAQYVRLITNEAR